jgi:hypothetical protein
MFSGVNPCEQCRLAGEPHPRNDEVVLETAADRQLLAHLDPVRNQVLGRPDSRQEQQLR